MSLLPAWWEALALEARRGMQAGPGPFWSGRFLCGQPIFGAPDLPFAGPGAVLLLSQRWGAALWLAFHALVLCAGLALWLRRGAKLDPLRAAALALLLAACLLACPASAALLGAWAWLPWVVVLLGADVSGWVAAPFCALLISGAAPTAILCGFLFSARASGLSKAWRHAWLLALFLAGPLELELLRQAHGSLSAAHPGWPLPGLGSPLAFFQACLVLLLSILCARTALARRGLVLGIGAGVLALGSTLLQGPHPTAAAAAGTYLRQMGRHQALPGRLPQALPALDAERWTGAGGGEGPRDSVVRWLSLSDMGVRDPQALSLADVAWVDSDEGPGVRWYQAVQAALVEGAISEDGPARQLGVDVFSEPLRVRRENLPKAPGSAWHILSPQRPDPGHMEFTLPPLFADAWLFVSESYDTGWLAEAKSLEGPWLPVPLVTSEGSFLAVPVAQSATEVRLTYSPPGLLLGLMLATLGFLVFCLFGFRSLAR